MTTIKLNAFSNADLRSLEKAIEKEKQKWEEAESIQYEAQIKERLEFLLEIVKHTRNSCNDDDLHLNNAYIKNGIPGCIRCILLQYKNDGFFHYPITHFSIDVSLQFNSQNYISNVDNEA